MRSHHSASSYLRLKILIQGAVQGVGFRPFVYRLAQRYSLKGWVLNSSQGVSLEVEGEEQSLLSFLEEISQEKPPPARITRLEYWWLDPVGYPRFEIRHSEEAPGKTVEVLPDLATCSECLQEIFHRENRRYYYPFTNCTYCGPRFTIITGIPYDRPHTTMAFFNMCPQCEEEYRNPSDRRFHAQPIACPQCGPRIWLEFCNGLIEEGEPLSLLEKVSSLLQQGQIIALKGIGGFQLLVDARNSQAVQKLRDRKHREEKPFATMFPSLEEVERVCDLLPEEKALLTSPESPIVLCRKKSKSEIPVAPEVAPQNPYLGVMLPYSPLHHLLMRACPFPLVCTSGNLSDEPIATDNREARDRLKGIADAFLMHNRPIARHCDDSLCRVFSYPLKEQTNPNHRPLLLRRARGYAPSALPAPFSLPKILAVGPHLKNTIALAYKDQVILSQHIGDLETGEAFKAFRQVIGDLQKLFDFEPELVVCDLHPDYLSTQYAETLGKPLLRVQHHHAHIAACMAENQLVEPVLGVAWDGTGYGTDRTVWGGEFLLCTYGHFERIGHLRPFLLPGGDSAAREPRRSALGLLFLIHHPLPEYVLNSWKPSQLDLLNRMLKKKVSTPLTTSMGRLFDAVASLIGLKQTASFEGQPAMMLEYALSGFTTEEKYPFPLSEEEPLIADWEPLLRAILEDIKKKTPLGLISARFHNALVELIVSVAKKVSREKVVLSGGCFQNKYLLERTCQRLLEEGFTPYCHQRVPPHDGGIALGQAVVAGALWRGENVLSCAG